MYSLREELRNLDNAVYRKKLEVNKLHESITETSTEITDMEHRIDKNKIDSAKIMEKKEELRKALEELEQAESPTSDDPILMKRFDELNLSGNPVGSTPARPPHPHNVFITNPDPFKSADPFSDDSFDPFGAKRNSNAGATSNFGSFGKDPFAQA